MKKYLLLLFLILVACAPAPPARQVSVTEPVAPRVETREEVVSPPQMPEKPIVEYEEEISPPGTPLEPTGYQADPYSQLGCERLLTAEEFAGNCGKDVGAVVVSYKIGTRNCFVNMKDRANERLTAGITLTGYKTEEDAEEEFDRRLKVLKVGADKSVGERAYTPPFKPVDREAMEFLRNEFIVEGGVDTRLCSVEGLLAVMRIVDGRIS